MARKPLSKRTRFEIFKRDSFRCVYCGATPVQGPLHVDHVIAVANGGTDKPDNLITACANCNLGKGAVALDDRKLAVGDPAASLDHAEQLRAYLEAQREVVAARESISKQLINQWCETIGEDTYHRRLEKLLPEVLDEFGMEKLMHFMSVVAKNRWKWHSERYAFDTDLKYFYGVIRREREGR